MSTSFLSPEFLAQYEGKRPKNAGVLFFPVFLRTYARWLEDKKRRETWNETIARVTEYSMSLYQGNASRTDLQKEAEFMYDSLFHLEAYPAGRSYWIAGTDAVKKCPEASFNCTMMVIDRLDAFSDLFHLLLVGAGVGYRLLTEDVAKLPRIYPGKKLTHLPYDGYPAHLRYEFTSCVIDEDSCDIFVGDSKEGWTASLDRFLEAYTDPNIKEITIDYDSIRPSGERIKTFGGRAPGHKGIQEMFSDIHQILETSNGSFSSVDCLDICNLIGKNVIVGGTRRSAQIALGSSSDEEFSNAKRNLFTDPTKQLKKHRTMSNNSLVFDSKPSDLQIDDMIESIRQSWEPGFLNRSAASKRRPWFAAVNPCGEALGADKGNCNLTGIVLTSFVEGTLFNLTKAEEAIRLATRIGMRQTNITWSLPHWDVVHKRDRLLGVSMTGIMDMVDLLGIEFDSPEAIHIWSSLGKAANDEADKYAFEMRIPRPLLVTVLKPEGSISQLPTVSSGIHRAYAPYYIRRIRVSSMDPVCKALQHLGVPNEPDQNKSERVVFSFPIKTQALKSCKDETAERQFDRYLTLMKYYVDHNASITIMVGEDEWEGIKSKVKDNWDDVVAVAFASKDYSQYAQLPYEEITKDQYEEMQIAFPNLDSLPDLVNVFESSEAEEDELESDCLSKGFCPVR